MSKNLKFFFMHEEKSSPLFCLLMSSLLFWRHARIFFTELMEPFRMVSSMESGKHEGKIKVTVWLVCFKKFLVILLKKSHFWCYSYDFKVTLCKSSSYMTKILCFLKLLSPCSLKGSCKAIISVFFWQRNTFF